MVGSNSVGRGSDGLWLNGSRFEPLSHPFETLIGPLAQLVESRGDS